MDARFSRLCWTTVVFAVVAATAVAQDASDFLTSRPRGKPGGVSAIDTGASVTTRPGQRQRLQLPDGAVLYVNENTEVKLEARDRLALARGEVFIEQTPFAKGAAPLIVETPQKKITAARAGFAVRVARNGPGVLVTRGAVEISGLKKPLRVGQYLSPGAAKPATAPRPSHVLHWTRDLMAAAESSLVPESEFAGGALVAVDPNGQETKLTLRKYHIDVHIEDGFARTTIDQTYFNHENWQMEGKFYFPLPADASLSRMAMYVGGNLMEAGMVTREYGANVYEEIRYMRKDPALLEWVDGSTFKIRIFPIEARREKRLLLSYTQKLSSLHGRLAYRFPAGHSLPAVNQWSLNVRVKDGAAMSWDSPSHDVQTKKDGRDLLLSAKIANALFKKDVVLALDDPALADNAARQVRFASAKHEGKQYLLVRLRPDLLRPDSAGLQINDAPKNWLFLFETSGDRDPLLARAQIEVIRHLLLQAAPHDTFNVMTANTRIRRWQDKPQPVTPENIDAAITALEKSHLIGALDLDNALRQLAKPQAADNTFLIHVGTAIPAMGERRNDILAKRLPKDVRYIGVGVGKRWNRSLMKAAAERTGGYFTQINPDEAISWRGFELFSTIQTLGPAHLRNVAVEMIAPPAGKNPPRFLHFNQLLTQGEELAAVIRLDGELPQGVRIKFGDGQTRNVPLQNVEPNADYLPRQWAKLEIDRLLKTDAGKHKDDIVKLSKAMYVMSPFTSLLVLENDDMYTQYKVDRGRKDHWALYPAPRKIEVVFEADPNAGAIKGRRKAKEVIESVVVRGVPRVLQSAESARLYQKRHLNDAEISDAFVREMTTPLGAPESPMPPMILASPLEFGIGQREVVGGAFFGRAGASRRQMLIRGGSSYFFGDPNASSATIGIQFAPLGRQITTGVITTSALTGAPTVSNGFVNRFVPSGNESLNSILKVHPVGQLVIPVNRDDRLKELELRRPLVTGGITFSTNQPLLVVRATDVRLREELLRRIDELKNKSGEEINMKKLLLSPPRSPSLLYARPGYSGDETIFTNLLAYAPGLNTSRAEILAVLDAESIQYRKPKIGKIDAGARDLINAARQMQWHTLSVQDKDGKNVFTINFDGQGRHTYQRTLPPGLRETVQCDGKTLQHRYPQIGLAAKRDFSRFHFAEMASALPWLVTPVEELARDADVKLMGKNTVAIVPHITWPKDIKDKDKITYQLRMIFAANGRLAERQLVKLPHGKKAEILVRQNLAGGDIKIIDRKGKEHVIQRGKLTATVAPKFAAASKNLVTIHLPYRSADFLKKKLKIEKKSNNQITIAHAEQLLAAYTAAGDGGNALAIFRAALAARNQHKIGYYVLLAAAGQNLDGQNQNVLAEHPESALANYLALHTSPVLKKHASQWAVNSVQWQDPLLKHLAVTHALYQRWQSDRIAKLSPARQQSERKKALAYVSANKDSAYGWVLLCLLQDKAEKDKAFHSDLAAHFKLFADQPALRYTARYEQARSLWKAGDHKQAREEFRRLYTDTFKDGVLPAIDSDFRQALLGDETKPDQWNDLLQQTATDLIKDKNRPAVLTLARQCWQLDDVPSANQMLALALNNIGDKKERAAMRLAAVQFYRQTSQYPEASNMLQSLLDDPDYGKYPVLWRIAADIENNRGKTATGIKHLEWALSREFANLPDIVNIGEVRDDYAKVLGHYEELANAMVTLKVKPSRLFFTKVIRLADRWRSLDNNDTQACEIAARILRTLGKEDLAWDYMTTPLAERPGESQPWVNLADKLRLIGKTDLAELSYKAASEAEPTNAQILWDRARNLEQSGKTATARVIYQRIADGQWQPRFQGLVSQARQRLR